MRPLAVRRTCNFGLLLGFSTLAVVVYGVLRASLHSESHLSGWLLLTIVGALALYGVRKKLVGIPLGSSSMWLQCHIYGGLLSFVVFVLHIGIELPTGILESVLAAVYLAVFVSGVTGLLLSRTLARRLTARGPQVLYRQIPKQRRSLAIEVEALLSEHADLSFRAEKGTPAGRQPVREIYETVVKDYFKQPRNLLTHLLGSDRPRRALLSQLDEYRRYLDADERELLTRLAAYVKLKDDLDYQYSLQTVLQSWPLLHVPLTQSLLLLAAYHAIVAHAYSERM